MEQQTMTGSGLYILIAVQLLFSMLIQLRIRQYRKKPTGCLLAASTLCISLSGMTLFTWLFSEAAFSDVAILVLSATLFTFGYMGLLAFLFKFNGSKLDAYILEDIDRSYRRIEETNEKGGKQ